MKNNNKQLVHLAALLHDIGKFYQKTEDDSMHPKELSQKILNLKNIFCPDPEDKNYHHTLWTAQFIDNFSSHLNKYLNGNQNSDSDKLLKTAASYQKPVSFLEMIIQKAHDYASGIDRKDHSGFVGEINNKDGMFSIFETINPVKYNTNTTTYSWKLPVTVLSLNKDDYFPTEKPILEPDYKGLWKGFIGEVKFIQSKSYQTFSQTLLSLLEKYTGRIPTNTFDSRDVSLYDHSKTTAAFATSLYEYVTSKNSFSEEELPTLDEQPFLLIAGDLSGIQKFIYDIAARGAAKNLKGRSFYLQLLVDNIVRYLLKRLDLFETNIIYSSGGGFYILAPNTEKVIEEIKKIEEEITDKLYKEHGTLLSLSIDFIPFGENELFRRDDKGTIGDLWMGLSEKLGQKKNRKFQHLIENNFDDFFEPSSVNPDKKRDYITGDELGLKIKYLNDDKDQPVNQSTYLQIELGKRLKKAGFWILSREKLPFLTESFNPIGLGFYNYFENEETVREIKNKLKNSPADVQVISFNKGDFLKPVQKGIDNVYGFTWYGGNDYPVNNFEEPKTFTELSGVVFDAPNYREEKQRKTEGPELARMGVLRMDVDNLGAMFRSGIPDTKRSFSRYCTLSRNLDYFFKGYLNELWNATPDYREYTQIIYAGGDDLFIVGKWDVLIKMAVDINRSFREWTCYNPNLTLSGGMAIVGSKFPILKSAEYSEVFEKKAKSYSWNGQEKNAFSVFGYRATGDDNYVTDVLFAFNWDWELQYVIELKNQITELMRGSLSRGFAGQIYNLMQMANFKIDKSGRYLPSNYKVIWLIAYQFKRSMQSSKNDEVKEFLDQWTNNIMCGKILNTEVNTMYHPLQLLALAARCSVLEQRSNI